MSIVLDPEGRAALEAYSRGDMSAIELRRGLDGATFGDVLIPLGREGLPMPHTPVAGREQDLARAERWLFGGDER